MGELTVKLFEKPVEAFFFFILKLREVVHIQYKEPFFLESPENELPTLYLITPKYFNMYFLYSYNTTVKIRKLALIHYYNLIL